MYLAKKLGLHFIFLVKIILKLQLILYGIYIKLTMVELLLSSNEEYEFDDEVEFIELEKQLDDPFVSCFLSWFKVSCPFARANFHSKDSM